MESVELIVGPKFITDVVDDNGSGGTARCKVHANIMRSGSER